jgi:branched-chain amino acid transport system permease protein
MKTIAERVAELKPNPVIAGLLSAAPFVIAFVLAIMMDTVVGPSVGPTWSKILTDVGIAIVLAASLNVVNGYAGQFSIGHAAFMLVGGYAAAWLTYYGSIHWFGTREMVGAFLGSGQQLFLAGCLLGGFIAAFFGVLVGLPTLRLRGDYLAIVTLGCGEIVRVLGQITSPQAFVGADNPKLIEGVQGRSLLELADNLGGAQGMHSVPPYTRLVFVYLFAFFLLILVYRLKYSSKGRALLAVRENEVAAEAVGVDTTRAKVVAFVFAAFFAGIGGALYVHQNGVLKADELGFQKSIDLVVIVVIGGMGSISGIVIGATIITVLPEVFRQFQTYRMIVYALALIAVMLARPQGIMGVKELWEVWWWRRLQKKLLPGKKKE